jgi:hypothetical protein
MEATWSEDTLVLVIDKSDLGMVNKEIVNHVFTAASQDEAQGEQVARFLVLGLAILFRGVLQFLLD